MKKYIFCITILSTTTIQLPAMQRLARLTKRSMVTVARKKNYTRIINRLAKKVAHKAKYVDNCDLNGNYVSEQFNYDILNAIHKELSKNKCIPQLEKGVEDIFYLVSQIKNESESVQFRVTHEKVKTFSERLKEKKE